MMKKKWEKWFTCRWGEEKKKRRRRYEEVETQEVQSTGSMVEKEEEIRLDKALFG